MRRWWRALAVAHTEGGRGYPFHGRLSGWRFPASVSLESLQCCEDSGCVYACQVLAVLALVLVFFLAAAAAAATPRVAAASGVAASRPRLRAAGGWWVGNTPEAKMEPRSAR